MEKFVVCCEAGARFWKSEVSATGAGVLPEAGDGIEGSGTACGCFVGDFKPLGVAGAPKENFGGSEILPNNEFWPVAGGAAGAGGPKLNTGALVCSTGESRADFGSAVGPESVAEVVDGAASCNGEGAGAPKGAGTFRGGDIIIVSSSG